MNYPLLKRSRIHAWMLTLALALGIGIGCDQPVSKPKTLDWKEFSPTGGRFTIRLPSEPVKQQQTTSTGWEETKYRIVTALSSVAAMAVAYADQPKDKSFESDPAKILDLMRDQAISNLNGQLVEEKQISMGQYPGRELMIRVKAGMTVRQRLYLANTRLYSLMVIAGSKGLTSPEAETFFSTFRIHK